VSVWAIIPAKDFSGAKSRLSRRLTPGERRQLSQFTLERVVRAAMSTPGLAGCVVVSNGDEPLALARRLGAIPIRETAPGPWRLEPSDRIGTSAAVNGTRQRNSSGDLNRAIRRGVMETVARGATAIMVIAGDLPLADAPALGSVIASVPEDRGMVIVPDRHGNGTNALLVRPPDALPFSYGEGSFHLHLGLARDRELPAIILRSPTLAYDVDTPEDLEALARWLDDMPATSDRDTLRRYIHDLLCHDSESGAVRQCR
jgi:2-phospho-L-lactate guanylyltransferase